MLFDRISRKDISEQPNARARVWKRGVSHFQARAWQDMCTRQACWFPQSNHCGLHWGCLGLEAILLLIAPWHKPGVGEVYSSVWSRLKGRASRGVWKDPMNNRTMMIRHECQDDEIGHALMYECLADFIGEAASHVQLRTHTHARAYLRTHSYT